MSKLNRAMRMMTIYSGILFGIATTNTIMDDVFSAHSRRLYALSILGIMINLFAMRALRQKGLIK